jgi:PAS domain S-box-containing protein
MNNKLRVLIVEDLPSDAELAERELSTVIKNYTVQVVDTNEEYVQSLETFKPDLIISDYQMPVFDGMSALMIKKEKSPHIPFIMLTGSMNEDTAVECMKAGADDYVIKEHIKRLGPAILSAIEKKKDELKREQAEEDVRNRERVYATLINNLPGFTYRCQNDDNWTMDFISAGCEDVTGYTPDDFINNKNIAFNDIIDPDYQTQVWTDWQKVLEDKTIFEYEYPLVTKSKEIKWIWERGCGIYSEEGKLLYLEGFITDVTERKQAVKELKESEEYFRTLIENSSDVISILDETGNIKYESTSHERVLGYASGELIGDSVFKLVHPDDRDRIALQFAGLLKKINGIELVNFKFLHQDGTWRYLEGTARNLLSFPKINGIVVNYRDVTNRKQAEEALRESEERLNIIFESAPDAYYLNDFEGKFTGGNKTAEKLLGYSKEEFMGKSFVEMGILHDDEVEQALGVLAENIKGKPTGPHEYSLIRKDGTDVDVEILTHPVKIDGKDMVLGIARDITKRKQAEEELIKLSTAVEQSPSVIAITDLNGKFDYVNPKFAEVTGYTIEETIGQNPSILKSGELSDDIYKELWKTISSGKEWHGEFHNKKKNGELFWESVALSPIFDKQGKITNYLKVAEDITDRKHAEEELKISNELNKSITKTAADAIISINTEGVIFSWNNAAEKIFGYSASEMIKKKLEIIIPSYFREKHKKGLERVNKGGKQNVIGKTIELTGLRKDGIEFPIDLSISKWETNNQIFYTSIIRDITDRKQAQSELLNSEERFRQISENSKEWIWEVDMNGLYTYSSNIITEMLGYRCEEITGKKYFYDLFLPDERDELKNAAFEVFKQKQTFNKFINRVLNKNGEIVWFSTSGIPILDDNGELLGYRGADINITERKLAEDDLKKKMNELEIFNDASVDREIKINELRKEINELLKKMGKKAKYIIIS